MILLLQSLMELSCLDQGSPEAQKQYVFSSIPSGKLTVTNKEFQRPKINTFLNRILKGIELAGQGAPEAQNQQFCL